LAILDDEGNIQAGAAEVFSQENETAVTKIACSGKARKTRRKHMGR
jgi:hypothetical protein